MGAHDRSSISLRTPGGWRGCWRESAAHHCATQALNGVIKRPCHVLCKHTSTRAPRPSWCGATPACAPRRSGEAQGAQPLPCALPPLLGRQPRQCCHRCATALRTKSRPRAHPAREQCTGAQTAGCRWKRRWSSRACFPRTSCLQAWLEATTQRGAERSVCTARRWVALWSCLSSS